MKKMFLGGTLFAAHGLIHVALPFVDLAIHGVAAVLFLWGMKDVRPFA